MPVEFAEISYTLTGLVIASYNKTTDVYGTPATLENGQMAEVEPEADNDQLRGYGVKVALLSVMVGAKVMLGAGGADFSVLAILSGSSNYTSGLTPNQVRTTDIVFGGGGLPYFGMLGKSPTDDGGLMVLGLRCVKLDAFPKWTLDGQANKFNLSENGGYAIPINQRCVRIKTYETASLWTDPANGTDFKNFFTSPA